ncbi:MAG: YraN family protein [Rhodospirillales bacterium]
MAGAADRRRASEAGGRRAETAALLALRLKGYRLVDRRFRCPQGEIDLIVRRGRVLAFVEVKARPTLDEAAHAIDRRQQDRIAAAAGVFLQRQPAVATLDCRFDAVLVAPGRWPRHLPAAWEATA